MKLATRTLVTTLLLIGSASAMASPGLTQQQCNDYPFKQQKSEVTHKQLMNELSQAARSVRELADYLDQHPDALLRGRKGESQ